MTDRTPVSASTAELQKIAPKNEGNPALRMMGLPRLRARLPSRRWMIFFAVTGSFAAAIIYDRQQKRKIQQKWCDAVSHLAEEPLSPQRLPRRITVFLEAPPGDYLLSARDYFKDFVKPILVAAAIEWDLVEGRREGDIRHKLADKIRDRRRSLDRSSGDLPDSWSTESVVAQIREKVGVRPSDDRGGDLVVGRHTWKEYVRGLHEGWLGPLIAPPSRDLRKDSDNSARINETTADASVHHDVSSATYGATERSQDPDLNAIETNDQKIVNALLPAAEAESAKTTFDESSSEVYKVNDSSEGKKNVDASAPYVRPAEYKMNELPGTVPAAFDPVVVIGFPHLLGFLNTPVRLWKYINKRKVAEETGAAVTAFVLSQDDQIRPFRNDMAPSANDISEPVESLTSVQTAEGNFDNLEQGEWQQLAEDEERNWHKSARTANAEGEKDRERPWQEPMTVDWRLGHRMRTVDMNRFRLLFGKTTDQNHVPNGATDRVGQIVANSAGGVLSGSSGGDPVVPSMSRPKNLNWKGSADPLNTISWASWLRGLVISDKTEYTARPWQQGMQAEKED